MIYIKILTVNSPNEFKELAQALSIDARIDIINLLQHKSLNVNEIASALDIPLSTATVNVKKLEEAGLIETEFLSAVRGTQKLCSLKYDRIVLDIRSETDIKPENTDIIKMPIGNYVKCEIKPTCGIVTDNGPLGLYDDPRTFYLPERVNAQLLWFTKGYVEYHFPNKSSYETDIKSMQFTAEVCSEAPYHKKNWPSDITLWINEVEIGNWTSPGDFGGHRGLLTPKWWGSYMTQYGLLKCWKVDESGSYIDGVKLSNVTIKDLNLEDNLFISIKIGVKEDSKNPRGLNLFGKHFGNYNEDMLLELNYL